MKGSLDIRNDHECRSSEQSFDQRPNELEREITVLRNALELNRRLLEISNRHGELTELLEEYVAEVKKMSGCEAIGLRILDEEGNIPYQAYDGFSRHFYEKESPLSIKSDKCMCISVIKGNTDPCQPFFTEHGSFYLNGTTQFLSTISEEVKGETRNTCNHAGYESVALVPIRMMGKNRGLIHLADSRKGMVPLEMVRVFEIVSNQLGLVLEGIRNEQVARKERNRSQRYLDLAGVILVAVDTEGVVTLINRKGCEILKYTESEIIGKQWCECFVAEPCREEYLAASKKLMGGETEGDHSRVIPLVTSSDEERVISWHDTAVRDEDGQIIGQLSSGEDITERRRSEEAKRIAERELLKQRALSMRTDRLRSLGQMATGIAHELNQPLSGVRGIAEHMVLGLQRGWDMSPQAMREKLEKIVVQADRMSDVINHIRNFANEAGSTDRKAISANDVVEIATDLLQIQLKTRGFVIEKDLMNAPCEVCVNPYSLEEAIINLILNARDAIDDQQRRDPDSVPRRIQIHTAAEEGIPEMIRVEIGDWGTGIPEMILPRIYEPFFTTRAPTHGTGLGLAITKGIVEQIGGTLSVKNRPNDGKGVIATITLPAHFAR